MTHKPEQSLKSFHPSDHRPMERSDLSDREFALTVGLIAVFVFACLAVWGVAHFEDLNLRDLLVTV
jgi:hypothetical protein